MATANPSSFPPPRTPLAPRSRLPILPPTIALIVGFLTAMFFLTVLLFLLYLRRCRRTHHRRRNGVDSDPIFATFSWHRSSGVDRAVIESLPMFRFGRLLRGQQGEQSLDCAVCLCGFKTAELLRLLPKCNHAFHVGCIDAWLGAHSTCPLCRRRVDPEDIFLSLQDHEAPTGRKLRLGHVHSPRLVDQSVPRRTDTISKRHSPRRHSWAGEKRSNPTLEVVVHRHVLREAAPRKSVDDGMLLRFAGEISCRRPGRWEDGTLFVEENAVAGSSPQRVGNRLVAPGEVEPGLGNGDGVHTRWNDVRSQHLHVLRQQMTGRYPAWRGGVSSNFSPPQPPPTQGMGPTRQRWPCSAGW